MKFHNLYIDGAYEIRLEPHGDSRGYFARVYDNEEFRIRGLETKWVQHNHSYSKHKWTLRGIHFQYKPDCEAKLIECVTGRVWYALVDLRKESDTYGKWTAVVLESGRNMLYIPEGVAVGMMTLTTDVHLVYNVSEYYAPDNEGSIYWADPSLYIKWPRRPDIISDKDKNGITWEEFEKHGL